MTTQHTSEHEVKERLVCWECDVAQLEEAESLKADLEQALNLLDENQWAIDGECPKCRNDAHFNHGHHPDCAWAGLLAKYGREVKYAN